MKLASAYIHSLAAIAALLDGTNAQLSTSQRQRLNPRLSRENEHYARRNLQFPSSVSMSMNDEEMMTEGEEGEPEAIINGRDMKPGERPYKVMLDFVEDGDRCGGSLISPSVVLTAAHCYVSDYGDGLESIIKEGDLVRINQTDVNDNMGVTAFPLCTSLGQGPNPNTDCNRATQAFVVFDPRYNDYTAEYDFAVLILPEKIVDIDPVALNADSGLLEEGDNLDVFGFGRTNQPPGDPVFPVIAQTVTVQYVTNDECDDAYSNLVSDEDDVSPRSKFPSTIANSDIQSVYPSMLCASAPGKDACNGDSGSAIVQGKDDGNEVQVGIVSWGEGCAEPLYPGVYSRVSVGYSWITSTACSYKNELCGNSCGSKSSKSGKARK